QSTAEQEVLVSAISSLFEPFTIHNLELKNRIVMSPMTRSFSPGGVPGENVAAYYRRRAENDVGLIITEGTVVDHPASANDLNVPRFFGQDALDGWRRVVHQVHSVGGRILLQLWHVGSVRKPSDSPNPDTPSVGPSGLRKLGAKFGEPMTPTDIGDVIDAFARGASEAKQLGFDGIEIHGAHGYLIDQFFWENTNERTDEYGGDLQRRSRFAIDIVKACRRAAGADFPILFRFSQWKVQDYKAKLAASPDALAEFLTPLIDAGVDVFHCSTRRFWEPAFEGAPLNLAGWTKKLTGVPVITVGSVGLDSDMAAAFRGEGAAIQPIDSVAEMVARGEVDLVAVGRALLMDAEWARKIRENRLQDLRPFAAESMKTLF
ncbi:MAG TPA: NADH:flavin oxidoreductase, partial [Steroidobacteraceae bacterium]|nr:NADH:flavin oxidoreductase [Steroidobacteraceae bacterium]